MQVAGIHSKREIDKRMKSRVKRHELRLSFLILSLGRNLIIQSCKKQYLHGVQRPSVFTQLLSAIAMLEHPIAPTCLVWYVFIIIVNAIGVYKMYTLTTITHRKPQTMADIRATDDEAIPPTNCLPLPPPHSPHLPHTSQSSAPSRVLNPPSTIASPPHSCNPTSPQS